VEVAITITKGLFSVSAVMPIASVKIVRPSGLVELRNAVLCGLAVVVAIALTNPIAESPFNDDWSYSFTVKKLLETGKLTYNGWASASLIAQAYWGLIWVKLFGFSYSVLRFSTVPLAAAAISICYLLGRHVGLNTRFAVFASLLVGVSPLYLPVASSFMTDAPGLFFTLLSMYGFARAMASPRVNPAIAWLVLGVLVGLVGGTGRQIVWVVPLAMAPYAAWIRRRDPAFVAFAIAGWVLVFAGALLTMRWFAHQPYAIPEPPISVEIKKALQKPAHFLVNVLAIPLTTIWVILPALWGVLRFELPPKRTSKQASMRIEQMRETSDEPATKNIPANGVVDYARETRSRASDGTRALVVLLLLIGPVLLAVKYRPRIAVAPWMGNTLSYQGVMGGAELAGNRPVVLPMFLRIFIAVVVLVVACIFLADLLLTLTRPLKLSRRLRQFLFFPEPGDALLPAMFIFAVAYFALLLPRCATNMAYDRYVLPLMPCVLFPLLLSYQRAGEWKVAKIGWVLLGIYALYGIGITQEITALSRARTVAANKLMTAGVHRSEIDAGFEFDFETQLENTGYINDQRILLPKGAYKKGLGTTYTLMPTYRIEFAPAIDTKETRFGRVDYTTYLYPFHRRIYIDEFKDKWWLDPVRAATHPSDKGHQIIVAPGGDDDQ
jgi:hypothetical protein